MSVPGPELTLANPCFVDRAYFLCGVGPFAQFRLPGVGAAAITPALGAFLV
jgi:hypothetical protein